MRATNMQLSFLGLEGFSVPACRVQTLPLVWWHARIPREEFTFCYCLHMNKLVVGFGPLYRRTACRRLHSLRIIYLPPVCMCHDWWKQQTPSSQVGTITLQPDETSLLPSPGGDQRLVRESEQVQHDLRTNDLNPANPRTLRATLWFQCVRTSVTVAPPNKGN